MKNLLIQCDLWKGWKISIGRCCNWTV